MRSFAPLFVFLLANLEHVLSYNFPNEAIQLSEEEIQDNPDLAFGGLNTLQQATRTKCKLWPGDADWPSQARWDAFNTSLGGALIKGIPPASYCYPGDGFNEAKCAAVRRGFSQAVFM